MEKEPRIQRIKQIFKENINLWKSVKSVVTILFLVSWLFCFPLASFSFEIEERPFTPPKEEKRIAHPLSYAHYSLGIIYDEEGDFKKAIKQYERALKYEPNSSAILTALGKDYFRIEKFKEARELFRQSMWRDPLSPQTHFLLGTLSIEKGRIERARECYQRAIDLEPDYAEAHFILGNLYARKGDFEKAIDSYEEVESRDID